LHICGNCGHHLLTPVARLGRDLRTAAVTLTDTEARFLVDAYYIQQEDRKRSRAQERALGEGKEPHSIITWFADQSSVMEKQIERALDAYTQSHMMGSWMRDVFGIGSVLSAGLLSAIWMNFWCNECHAHSAEDCKRWQEHPKKGTKPVPHEWNPVISLPTTGQIWQFAGLAGDGQHEWKAGTKRPWNQQLKTLCWKIGDSFVKFSNDERCFYGRIYRERKEQEVAFNAMGRFRQHAENRLARDKKRGKSSKEAAAYHEHGFLSPGHLDLRARRYAVKLFLSHMHDEWYRRAFGTEPPAPYPIGILGHAHRINPPRPGGNGNRGRKDAAE
jgi:hypothetical protein